MITAGAATAATAASAASWFPLVGSTTPDMTASAKSPPSRRRGDREARSRGAKGRGVRVTEILQTVGFVSKEHGR